MPTPVIPTLQNGVGIIKKKENILAYLLRHTTACPGSTSATYEDELLSLRKLTAQYGHEPDQLAGTFAVYLKQIIQRFYDDASVTVECNAVLESATTYTLNVKVLVILPDGSEEPAISHGKIYITDNREFKIDFGE